MRQLLESMPRLFKIITYIYILLASSRIVPSLVEWILKSCVRLRFRNTLERKLCREPVSVGPGEVRMEECGGGEDGWQ